MISRLITVILILSVSLFASPITIGGLSYVSADPGTVANGFLVTDLSGVPMPYRCDKSSGFVNCSANQPEDVRWIVDTSDKNAGIVRISTPGRFS